MHRRRFTLAGALLLASAVVAAPMMTPPASALVLVSSATTAAPLDAVRDAASARVTAMSTREQAASIVMGHISTTSSSALNAFMASNALGGFILMGPNVPASEAGLRAVTAALTVDPALPPLIGIDQEGGVVSRIPWDTFATPRAIRSQGADAHTAFLGRASLIARAGANINFGILADYTDNSASFIYPRVLGTTPESAAQNVAAAVRGEEGLVASTIKHFPGHGAVAGDSHVGIPTTNMSLERWRASEAQPFVAGIEDGVNLVMMGHLAYTAVDAEPASLSAEWHRILREELGFTGVAVSDDLGMLQASGIARYRDPVANAVAAVAAGTDLVLIVLYSNAQTAPRIIDGLVAAVESGALPAERLHEAAERVMTLRLRLAAGGAAMQPCGGCAAVAP